MVVVVIGAVAEIEAMFFIYLFVFWRTGKKILKSFPRVCDIIQETFRIQGNNSLICDIVKDNRKSISLICLYGLLFLHLL